MRYKILKNVTRKTTDSIRMLSQFFFFYQLNQMNCLLIEQFRKIQVAFFLFAPENQ